MDIGPEAECSNVCSMLRQLSELQLSNCVSGCDSDSLIKRVKSALSALPAGSLLHARWQKIHSQYDEATASVTLKRSQLLEARALMASKDQCSGNGIETPPGHTLADISGRSSTRPQSYCGNFSPPICHVKPIPILSQSAECRSTAFDVRNYLIDKNAPVVEPVFKPHLASLVDSGTEKFSEVPRRHSTEYSSMRGTPCTRTVRASVKSADRPAAAVQSPVRLQWKTLKKKAVGLLTDGLRGRNSPSQKEHCKNHQLVENLRRYECSLFF